MGLHNRWIYGKGPPWKSDMANTWDYPFSRTVKWVLPGALEFSFHLFMAIIVKPDAIKGKPIDPD